MSGFRFQSPLWLLLAIPIFLIVWWAVRRQRQTTILFSDVSLLRRLPVTLGLRIKRLLPWLRALGLIGIVLAFARPQFGEEQFRIRSEGIALEMCLDRSGSMLAHDFQNDDGEPISRLQVVKDIFEDFVDEEGDLPGRPDDQIGLVVFGGFAESLCPLTLDHALLLELLETVEVSQPIYDSRTGQVINEELVQEEQATAIGDALTRAIDRLKNSEAKSRVIVLLSDGENTAGVIEPLEAARAAATFGIRIYTIGVGSNGAVPFPDVDRFGRRRFINRILPLDEETLEEIAETTGGRYFRAEDTDGLRDVYAEIDALEKTETEGRVYTEYREIYSWFLFPGIGLVLAHLILAATRFRSLP
ncbi:MAG: VWA domain-containing protein [Planctomycetota bacterium]